MDTTTFHDLYRAHAADIFRFARYLTGSDDAAEEIVSETFLRAWAGRSAVQVATAKAYLLAIARNLARDRHRHSRRWSAAPVPEQAVSGQVEASLELALTLEAFEALPATYREPLALAASGLGYDEIGRVLGLPLSTVKIRVHRARLMLQAARSSAPRSSR
jgi:RNA polymerase sigma-70 factor (ECF subfamily)